MSAHLAQGALAVMGEMAAGDIELEIRAIPTMPVAALRETVLVAVETTEDEVTSFQVFQMYLEDNPREIIRLVNLHRLVKIVLYGSGAVPPRPRQRKLLKWLVSCDRWPHLIDDVLAAADVNAAAPDAIVVAIDRLPNGAPASQTARPS